MTPPLPKWLVVGLLVLLFGWLIIFGDQGLLTWRTLAEKKNELLREEAALTAKKQLLETETTRLEDPQYLEPVIRRELGYVKPGETVYQFPEEQDRQPHRLFQNLRKKRP